MDELDRRVAIVTGASRGLGLATAKALSRDGWVVVMDARDARTLEGAAEDIGRSVIPVPGDISDEDHRATLIETARRAGGLDLLVNNASMLGPSPQPHLAEYPLTVLRRVYEVNVVAPIALIQRSLPILRERSGVIVNVTSDAATEAYAGWAGYGSSKAALNQASYILAAEEEAVRVYCYDPGDMNTQMHQEAFPGEDISDRPSPEDSVPTLLALVARRPPSGSYRVAEVVVSR